jgi:hypothetical protein
LHSCSDFSELLFLATTMPAATAIEERPAPRRRR